MFFTQTRINTRKKISNIIIDIMQQDQEISTPEIQEQQKVHVLTRQAILEEAKKQEYELTDELIDTPMKEGMIALLLFPEFEKVILPFPTYTVNLNPNQDVIKINIPKVSDGVSNVSICFKENVVRAVFDIVSTVEDGSQVSVYQEVLEKEQLLNSGVEYGNWIAFPKTFNTILDIMELKEETPFIITLFVEPSETPKEAEVGFERIYYKRV